MESVHIYRKRITQHVIHYLFSLLFLGFLFLLLPAAVYADDRTMIFVGDSRTVGMHMVVKGSSASSLNGQEGSEVWIGEVAMGYQWFADTGFPSAVPYLRKGNCDLVILMGVNDCMSSQAALSYTEYLKAQNVSALGPDNRFYFASVTPVGHRGGGSETTYNSLSNDGSVVPFNQNLQNSLPDDFAYIDLYDRLLQDGYSTVDGVHYDGPTYQAIYQMLQRACSDEDSSLVKRKTYTLTMDADGGTIQGKSQIELAAGDSLADLPSADKSGYVFQGWQAEDGSQISENSTMPAQNITLKAVWAASDSTPYTVISQFEKASGDPEVKKETETGTTGEDTTVTPEHIDGYMDPEPQTQTIAADGFTVFTFVYQRQSYTLTIVAGKGVRYTGEKTQIIPYQDPVALQADCKKGYKDLTVSGDASSLTFPMPAGDCQVTLSAEPTSYSISCQGKGLRNTNVPKTFTVEDLPLTLSAGSCRFPFVFRYWTDSKKQKIDQITDTGDVTLCAVEFNLLPVTLAGAAALLLLILLISLFVPFVENGKYRGLNSRLQEADTDHDTRCESPEQRVGDQDNADNTSENSGDQAPVPTLHLCFVLDRHNNGKNSLDEKPESDQPDDHPVDDNCAARPEDCNNADNQRENVCHHT